MMKRTLIAILTSVALASAASAATISAVIQGGNSIAQNAAVTIDLVTSVTNPEATLSLGLDARLLGNGGLTWTGATQTNLTSFGGGLAWTTFPTICSGGDPCVAVNQANPVLPAGAQPDTFNGTIATATANATGAPGVYNLDLTIVDYFGAAPSTQQYTIVGAVPEPAIAGLLGLGLFGLAFASRRR